MNRSRIGSSADRSAADLAVVTGLRMAISHALIATPIDEHALHQSVWRYVDAERHGGPNPEHVIRAITELIKASKITTATVRQALIRRVERWCVEAYFGQLGSDVAVG